MARVTVEDCLVKVPNRFALVHLAAQRVRQLKDGAPAMLESKNKKVVVALREIASGSIYPVTAEEAERERAEAEERERMRLSQATAAMEAEAKAEQEPDGPAAEEIVLTLDGAEDMEEAAIQETETEE